MMKKYSMLSALFIVACAQGEDKIVIKSDVLKIIDGTSFVNIGEIVRFGIQIKTLWKGKKDRSTGNIIGLIEYEGQFYTVEQLALLEKSPSALNMVALDEALNLAVEHFQSIAEPYLEQAKGTKKYMVALIEQWSKQRNKPDTALLEWSKQDNNEKEAFQENVQSFGNLNDFLEDLILFLTDFISSCPKSNEKYEAAKLAVHAAAQNK